VNSRILHVPFVNTFATFRKATITFVMSVRPSICVEQLWSLWTNCNGVWCLVILRKCARKIQLLLKSNKLLYFTWRPTHICDHISHSSF